MKRLLTIGLMLASAFALTNCAEQLESPYQEDAIVDEKIDDTIVPEEGIVGNFEVYTVDEDTKTGFANNAITWISGTDKISVYSTPSADTPSYVKHGPFTNNGGQRFTGDLKSGYTLSNQNNWYFIYPYTTQNPSSTSTIQETLTIGSATQVQDISSDQLSMAHLAGENCPMYAIINDIPKDKTPKKKMSLLYSIVELKIHNVGDGISNTEQSVVINEVGFTAPEEIVGSFLVDNLEGIPSFTAVSASKEAKVTFASSSSSGAQSLTITPGATKSVYLAVKPFNASNKEITLKINGLDRKVKMPYNFSFEAGKVTTLNVPISHKKGSKFTNVLDDEVKVLKSFIVAYFDDAEMVVFDKYCSEKTLNINGEEVSAYVIGTEDHVGSVTLQGRARDLVQRLPAHFYAASWNGKKAVMRLEKVKAILNVLFYVPVEKTYSELTPAYMSADKITFDGLVPIQFASDGKTATFIDEEPIHKPINEETVQKLLLNFDDNEEDNLTPTFQGLIDAVLDYNSIDEPGSEASITANCIFNKIKPKMSSILGDSLSDTFFKIFQSPTTLFWYLSEAMSFEVTLSTVMPSSTEKDKDPRIVVWGINSPNSN